MRLHMLGQCGRLQDVRGVEVQTVELQQAERGENAVVKLGGERRRAALVADGGEALRRRRPCGMEQEVCELPRGRGVTRIVENPRRPRQRREHQPVPRGETLGVRQQRAALAAVEPQALGKVVVAFADEIPALVDEQVGDAFPVVVALGGDVIALAEMLSVLRAEHRADLLRRKEIILTLLAAAVRVLPAGKAAVLLPQLTQAVVERALGDRAPEGVAPLLPGLGAAERQQRVIVERLFKVRREPLPVGAVAAEAAAQVVVNAAAEHLLQRELRHCAESFVLSQLCLPQQEEQVLRRGELRRAAEAAVLLVEGGAQLIGGPLQHALVCPARGRCGLARQIRGDLRTGFQQRLPVVPPAVGQHAQQGKQAHPAAAALPRQIGAGEEGLLLRRHNNCKRPAAAAVEGGADLHIHGVHVGPLLPVHLDGHIVPVQHRGHALVLEGLPRHHMAPVAGGVTDGEKDGLVLPAGLLKGLRPPGIPVHRVLRVLQQVGRALVCKMIRHGRPPENIYRVSDLGYTLLTDH